MTPCEFSWIYSRSIKEQINACKRAKDIQKISHNAHFSHPETHLTDLSAKQAWKSLNSCLYPILKKQQAYEVIFEKKAALKEHLTSCTFDHLA